MDKFQDIKNRLIFTYHCKDNLRGCRQDYDDRTDISINQIVKSIEKGVLSFAGSRRMMKTHKGITVVYKEDRNKNIVIITYYKNKKNKYKNFRKFY